MVSTQRPQHGSSYQSTPPRAPSPPLRTQRGLSPPPSTQRPRPQLSVSSLSRSSSTHNGTSSLAGSSPSRSSSPTWWIQETDLQHKISALEDTINRLENAGSGGNYKKRYEYIGNKGMILTFDLILPAGLILRFFRDVESVESWICTTIYQSYCQRQANIELQHLWIPQSWLRSTESTSLV